MQVRVPVLEKRIVFWVRKGVIAPDCPGVYQLNTGGGFAQEDGPDIAVDAGDGDDDRQASSSRLLASLL
jgi:hypothetical protein